jgi:APA family basic amino acid/polyamine antiporter
VKDKLRENSHPQTVKRAIGGITATNIVVANIIGAGIFITPGIIAGMLPGAGWVLACWVFGGLIAIAGAFCYTELSTRMPKEGAEYVYLKELYHPVLGFLTGWTSFIVGFSAAIAASAMGFSEYLVAAWSHGSGELAFISVALLKKGMAVSLIVIFTLIHYMGVRFGSGVQNSLTVLKIIIVLGLASLGLLLGNGEWGHITFERSGTFSWLSIGTAMMLVMYAYSGWNASAYIAGEVKHPKRTLPLSLLLGTSIVILLYIAMNLFIFTSAPYSELRGEIAIGERAAVKALGDWMGQGLSVMISLALLSSLSAYIIIGPRVYFAMAQDRLFFPFASKVHPRFGVPGRSIVIQGAIAMALVMIGSFEQLLIYLGFALGIFPWLAVAGLFIARKRQIGESSAVKVPAWPLLPLFFLASTLFLMVIAFVNRPLESSAAIVTVLAGIPCYILWVKVVRDK